MATKENAILPGQTRLHLRLSDGYWRFWEKLAKVDRYTATTVITKDGLKFRLSDGRQLGGRGSAEVVTEEILARLSLEKARGEAYEAARNIPTGDLSGVSEVKLADVDELRAITKRLEEMRGEVAALVARLKVQE